MSIIVIRKVVNIIKTIFTIILGILATAFLLTCSVILWYIMIQSTCKLTVLGIVMFLIGGIFMKYYLKNTN